MKIALLRRSYITTRDGVNSFIFSLADGLENLGHSVHIMSWSYSGVEKRKDLSEWAKKTYNVKTDITAIKCRQSESTPWVRVGWDWVTKGSRMLKDLGVDVVIINGIVPLCFNGKKIAVNHGLFEMPSNRLRKIIAKRLYRKCVRICVSQKLAQEYFNFFDLDSIVIPLPLRLSMFRPSKFDERENAILHVGTRPVKNLNISIEAVKILKEKGMHPKLIVVGSRNDHAENLLKRGRECGVDIEAKGTIPVAELAGLYSKAKALILPSQYEALSYVIIESMASGTPVVVSSQISEEEVQAGHNGFRIDTCEPAHYAKALAELLENQDLWTRLSNNGILSVKRFDHVEVAKNYVRLITD